MSIFKDRTPFVKVRSSSQPFTRSGAPYPRAKQIPSITKTLLRVVRLTGIIILIACLHVSAGINAQERISINMKSAPLEKVFAEIELRSGYTVFYNTEVLKYSGRITVEMKDATVSDVMHQVLKGLPLEFNIQDKTIFVKHVKATADASDPEGPGKNGATPSTVSGIVQTEAGQPLVGATVYIKRLKKTAMTDAKGEIALKDVPDGEYEVDITYVGFERLTTKITVVNHEASFTAALRQMMSKLDETVVKGYYSTTDRLNTGNVSTVKSEDIEKQPAANVLQAIEGRVPGIFVTPKTGMPGSSFTVQIRGQNSIVQGNDPLYIIDGVPYASETLGSLNGQLGSGNPLNFLNPLDIERVDVLKDADATAIYGSRAANGAVLITTKKGKEGSTKVDLNFSDGEGKVPHFIKLLNTPQYLEMRHEAFANDGVIPTKTSAPDLLFWDTTRYTNWQKSLIGNAAQYMDGQASVSGGNANTQFLIGADYHKETTVQPTIVPGQGADQKGALHWNINNVSGNKKFRVTLSGDYMFDQNTVQQTVFARLAALLPPDAPSIYNAVGSLNWAPLSPGSTGTWGNPFATLYPTWVASTSNLVTNVGLSYMVLPNLELKTSLGYTDMRTDEVLTNPTTASDPGSRVQSGYSETISNTIRSWIAEPQANYSKKFGQGALSALIGATFEQNVSKNLSQLATGFSNDALLQDIEAASAVYINTDLNNIYKYDAAFGRLSFEWDDKYLINLTGRRDGSSRFGPAKQFANFGAIGIGWIFSKERFMEKFDPILSFGKIRASYGTTGNDQIGDYQFLNLYTSTTYPYQGAQGVYPNNLYNPYLEWELTKKTEGGLELGLFKNRALLSISYYYNRSGNQLVNYPLSEVTGFTSIQSNLSAVVQNSGQEYLLTTTNIKTKNFVWNSRFNLTIPKNKLISFPGLSTSSYNYAYVIGQPITSTKTYHWTGVNDTTGVYQFASSKGGNTYTPNSVTDRTAVINTAPKFYGGIDNEFSYKGLSISVFLQFVSQTGDNYRYSNGELPGLKYNQPVAVLNHWQTSGEIKPIEKFSEKTSTQAYKEFGNYLYASDVRFGNASFLRIKNLSVSYELPDPWKKKMSIRNCMIYLHAQNVFTITKYDGFDPETQGLALPPLRTITGGVRLSL